MKNFFLYIALSLSAMKLVAQSGVVLPSPAASGIVRNGNVPVNLYTGVPQIEVPLYSLPHSNGSSMPVGISYHAGGIKVQDVAGPVGLGWNLSAGGMITRVVRGLPDEDNNFFDPNESIPSNKFVWVAQGTKDGEHDMFYFSFPGRGGQFQVDKTGQKAYTMPFQDIEIKKIGTFGNCEWIITDEQGNKYYFGQSPAYREDSHITVSENGDIKDSKSRYYTSTWYLSKIKYLNSPTEIIFKYISGEDYSYDNFSAVLNYSTPYNANTGCGTSSRVSTITTTKIISPKFVSRISTNLSHVDFLWKTGRRDLNMLYLDEMVLKDYNFNTIESYEFVYGYYDSGDSYLVDPNISGLRFDQVLQCDDKLCKRLRLDLINRKISGQKNMFRKFEYKDNRIEGINNYDVYELPPRNNGAFDHWGYFNGSNADGINGFLPMPGEAVMDALRTPHKDFTQAGMLKRIEVLGGAYQELEFESNQTNSGIIYGGLRIAAIRDFKSFDDQDPIVISYEYYDGFSAGFGYPKYEFNLGGINATCSPRIVYSSAPTQIYDLGGVSIGYGKVVKNNPNGSKEIYYFTTSETSPDIAPSYNVGSQIYNYPPMSPVTSNHWQRGLNTSVEYYEVPNGQGDIVYKTVTTYLIPTNPEVTFENIAHLFGAGGGSESLAGTYFSNFSLVRPVAVIEYRDGSANPTSKSVNYYHNNIFKTLITSKDFIPYGENFESGFPGSYRTYYRYYHDIFDGIYSSDMLSIPNPEVRGLISISDSRAINIPIEIHTKSLHLEGAASSSKIYSSTFITFKDYGNFIAPYNQYKLQLADPISSSLYSPVAINESNLNWDKDTRFIKNFTQLYDEYGNLISYIGRDDVSKSYTWGYNNSLVTSETINGEFTTTYEHIPLVGISKVTDPNGKTTTYEYDHMNRLKLIRDHNDNILERYRYNSVGEPKYELNANFWVDSYSQSGITFKAQEFYGQTLYSWDFGDGTKVNTNESTISHSFSGKTSSNVRLTLTNPEYETSNLSSKTNKVYVSGLTITDSKQVDLCKNVSTVQFAISGADECGSLQTKWYYKVGTGNWILIDSGIIGNDGRVLNFHNFSKTNAQQIAIKCVIMSFQGCSIQNGTELQTSMITGFSNSNCMQDIPY